SRVGKGSVFSIHVPIGREVSEEWRKQLELPAAGKALSIRGVVLVVEDDPAVREALQTFLARIMRGAGDFCGGCGAKRAIHVANWCSDKLHRVSTERHSRHDRRYTAS